MIYRWKLDSYGVFFTDDHSQCTDRRTDWQLSTARARL